MRLGCVLCVLDTVMDPELVVKEVKIALVVCIEVCTVNTVELAIATVVGA